MTETTGKVIIGNDTEWLPISPDAAANLWRELDALKGTFATMKVRLQRGDQVIWVEVSKGVTFDLN